MSATITATGTPTVITGLSLGTAVGSGKAPAAPGGIPQGMALGLNLESLKTQDGVIYPELQQFVVLVGGFYGLSYHAALDLVEVLMRALKNAALPMQRGDASGERIFTP